MSARVLMVQGTGSSVGKSTLVAGLARAFTRRGLRVLPFKPQNMSNNAAVTWDGGEIGRAQALQARACGVPASVDMNPVLLKPQGETGAQLVVQGRIEETVQARDYQGRKALLMPSVLQSFFKLAAKADLVLVEGAGSASEVNLRAHDIANMGFAEAVNAPVVLVGDIDRGGVIASLVGTQVVVSEKDAQRIKGFIVNRMRGDPTLFTDGMQFVAERTGWQPLGLVPDLPEVRSLPAEDAADLDEKLTYAVKHSKAKLDQNTPLRIVVPLLPMIANFDDLDPLYAEPGVHLMLVKRGQSLPECDLIILPGSKATLSDLACLKEQGWDKQIAEHVTNGGYVMGICGGYQMLGATVADPYGTEGAAGQTAGLGLLKIDTVLSRNKSLEHKEGKLAAEGSKVAGYEMHVGQTIGADCQNPLIYLDNAPEGAVSANGHVWGTYLHGIFNHRAARMALLARVGGTAFQPDGVWDTAGAELPVCHDQSVEHALDTLANHLEQHIDLDALLQLAAVPAGI
ncbi:cobyric acid synthase CobQ [Acetobacter pasteurianus NBRC 3188]|uniref:Cobyric acid synthase n=2 Tax=Acetobacter pasteurianus TaxID=438 RepID=A0A401WVS7_ACEPA|nr:cobyric acid synthase CobQ [Acetobacter pasteurianus NBRC 3188]